MLIGELCGKLGSKMNAVSNYGMYSGEEDKA